MNFYNDFSKKMSSFGSKRNDIIFEKNRHFTKYALEYEPKILNIKKHYYLSIVAIFKNESWILEEWLNHYLNEGVDHFFLIDNDSSDDYISILKPFIDKKQVTLFKDRKPNNQKGHYNKYILPVKNISEWFLVCDLDEFVYSRNEFNKISDYLKKLNDKIGNVFIPWKIFGSSGLKAHPKDGVLNNFSNRAIYDKNIKNICVSNNKILCKTIIRSKYLVNLAVHIQQCNKSAFQITSDNKYLNNLVDNTYININEDILKNSNLHLNHYPIQSVEFFQKIKMTRGDATNIKLNNYRNMKYFYNYDKNSNKMSDEELSIKDYKK